MDEGSCASSGLVYVCVCLCARTLQGRCQFPGSDPEPQSHFERTQQDVFHDQKLFSQASGAPPEVQTGTAVDQNGTSWTLNNDLYYFKSLFSLGGACLNF